LKANGATRFDPPPNELGGEPERARREADDRGGQASVQQRVGFKPALELLPYQQRWLGDSSPLKIVVKARQIGFSFAATLRAVFECLRRKTTWIFLSKGERQSRLLMEKVQEHIQSCGIIARTSESSFFEGTMTKQLEARFPNGSVIYGLPANPDTARGYTGNVTLDEFAFHQDAAKVFSALYPTITRGYQLEVVSTPNGQQGKFFEIAKQAGLVGAIRESPLPARNDKSVRSGGGLPSEASRPSYAQGATEGRARGGGWSGHRVDIFEAAREGLKVDIEALRAGCDDEETWLQEFCCQFVSQASDWIPAELFQQCVSSEASITLPTPYSPPQSGRGAEGGVGFYAGWDIARKHDLSVIWVCELVGDVTWTRAVIELRNTPTPNQVREARGLLPLLRRMNIDQSGMGLAIFEQLAREFPGKVEGVGFTQPTKEAMAVLAKRRMEETKVRIPDSDQVRASFRSVKKTMNALGQARFDSEHDSKYGHADHWWAFCLAETAAERPTSSFAQGARLVGQPIAAGLGAREL